MKRELWINIVLGIISLVIIGIIIMRATPAQKNQITPPIVHNNQSTIQMNVFTRHNTANDCWIRINGKVYDVTGFLTEHPGGAETILPSCGGSDATEAFATKGGRGTHSSQAENLHTQMFMGTLSE
jgi:cytochrome b involved in lipid metabolism